MFSQNTIRMTSLAALIIQGSCFGIITRYSQISKRRDKSDGYLVSTVICLSELLKFCTCLMISTIQRRHSVVNITDIFRSIFWKNRTDLFKMMIPGMLYTIQNYMVFFALSQVDAATYQVLSQLKILTTALWAVLIMKQKHGKIKWFSLCLLTSGVMLTQWPVSNMHRTLEANKLIYVPSVAFSGIGALLLATCISGFAGVYTEKIIKGEPVPILIRNVQLASLSGICALIIVFTKDYRAVQRHGFFVGYSPLVWIIIFLQAIGGVIIAFVIKYADNLVKVFITSICILTSALVSYFYLEDFEPNVYFNVGVVIILVATFMYTYERSKAQEIQLR